MKKKSKNAQYVDGFVLSVPKNRLAAYKRIATKASEVWREHGAIDYFECVGNDLKVPVGVPFNRIAKTKANEVVVFAWITYKSKAHRNQVNKKVMQDPRLAAMMGKEMPFDHKRMSYGGFKVLVANA